MEKNLPLLSFSPADKGYNKIIIPFIGKLDDGNVFKNIITFLMSLGAIGILLGGFYLSIAGIFGDEGFIKMAISREGITSGKIFGSILGLIFGLPISLLTTWALYSIIKKRTEQLKIQAYQGLLDYIFNKTIPKIIIILGEILFVLILCAGILQITASIIGSYVYAPLNNYPVFLLGMIPGINVFQNFIPRQIFGDYSNFGEFLKMGLIEVVVSFIVLIAFYLYKEVYNYFLKLVTVFINFLPKFAFPLAVRKREELPGANERSGISNQIDLNDI